MCTNLLLLFSIDCIDPDNKEASSVIKIHLCFVLCYTVHRFSILNLLAWTLTWGDSARPSRRQREAEGTWGSPCPPESCMEVTALLALRSLPPARLEADSCWGKRKEEKGREKRWSQFRFLSKGCRCFSSLEASWHSSWEALVLQLRILLTKFPKTKYDSSLQKACKVGSWSGISVQERWKKEVTPWRFFYFVPLHFVGEAWKTSG